MALLSARRCGMECKNRLVQFGPRYRLEVFRCCQPSGEKLCMARRPDFPILHIVELSRRA